MKIIRGMAMALLGLLLSAAMAIVVSTWLFQAEKDGLLSFGGFRLSVSGAGAGLALLVLLTFANGWIGERGRRGEQRFPQTIVQGLGFGLLPALSVWKAFEQMTARGAGAVVEDRMPAIPWLTEAGLYQPCRVEMVLLLLAFAGEILWLVLRKEEVPENGDLLPLSMSLWATVRLITERFRAGEACGIRPMEYVSAGVLVLCLALWVTRAFRQHKNTGYAWACVPVMVASLAAVALQGLGILSVNPAADLAIRCACALLALKAVVCMGRVTRQA